MCLNITHHGTNVTFTWTTISQSVVAFCIARLRSLYNWHHRRKHTTGDQIALMTSGAVMTLFVMVAFALWSRHSCCRTLILMCDCNRRLAASVSTLQCAAPMLLLLLIVHTAGRGYVAFQWLLFLAN